VIDVTKSVVTLVSKREIWLSQNQMAPLMSTIVMHPKMGT
jgi:Mg/Co/Ni transporter MgtE